MRRLIAIDARWMEIVLPATACLRLGPLIAIAIAWTAAGGSHVAVYGAAIAVVLYAAAYTGAWIGKLRAPLLGYSVLADACVIGVLTHGGRVSVSMATLLSVPVIAVAQFTGGVLMAPLALIALAAGWGIAWLGNLDLRSVPSFDTALAVEALYRGSPAFPVAGTPNVWVLLVVLLSICAAGGVALMRTAAEQRRAARARREVEALEAIVDCLGPEVRDEDLWKTVAQSAALLSGARVHMATVEGGAVRLRVAAGTLPNSDVDQTGEWILRNLRIPRAASGNPIVRAMLEGTEEETNDILALTSGSERSLAPEVVNKLQSAWGVTFLVMPILSTPMESALVAVARGDVEVVRDALRRAAQRTALVLRVRHERKRDLGGATPVPVNA